jgi:hypothetical protein
MPGETTSQAFQTNSSPPGTTSQPRDTTIDGGRDDLDASSRGTTTIDEISIDVVSPVSDVVEKPYDDE